MIAIRIDFIAGASLRLQAEPGKLPGKSGTQIGTRGCVCTGPTEHYNIHAGGAAVQFAKALSREAFDEITFHGGWNVLLGDRQSQSVLRKVVSASEYQQLFLPAFLLRRLEYRSIICCAQQSLRGSKALCHGETPRCPRASAGSVSGCQALAALCTAAGDDCAAALGGHAGAEAVGTLALEYAGLKCSLHV